MRDLTSRKRVARWARAIAAAVAGPGMHGFTCGPPPTFVVARTVPAGATPQMSVEHLDPTACDAICGPGTIDCRYAYDCVAPDGGTCAQRNAHYPPNATPLVLCMYRGPFPGAGRACAGLDEPASAARSEMGAYFARMAWLEGASVHAFRMLARELDAHGAPRSLALAASRAARDEERHARVARALARRHGASTPRVRRPAPRPPRPLAELALDNATEGCVRETFGAVVLAWQARVAEDPHVRRALARIADDEAGHAALARRVARFLDRRVDRATRARVARARRETLEALERESNDVGRALLAAARARL